MYIHVCVTGAYLQTQEHELDAMSVARVVYVVRVLCCRSVSDCLSRCKTDFQMAEWKGFGTNR
jgi:hypothetical protein